MAAKQLQPSPMSVLTALYKKPNEAELKIDKIDETPIKTQMSLLQPDNCSSRDGRNNIVTSLNNEDLNNNAYKRIRFKRILSDYYKHYLLLKHQHFKMVQNWNDRDFSLNVIIHFILDKDPPQNESEDKEKKRLNTTWKFVDFLRQFFAAKNFNGKEFIEKHGGGNKNDNNKKGKTSGFGLSIVKDVCKEFDQKTGKYTKVKKALSAWAKNNVERHHKESNFALDEYKNDPLPIINEDGPNNNMNNGNNFKSDIQHKPQSEVNKNANNNNANNNDKNKNTYNSNPGGANNNNNANNNNTDRWYWFCDENEIKWIPYRNEHQGVIDNAWNMNKGSVIVAEKFKIEFHREGTIPAGQQYNYLIHNSWRRGVVKGSPDENKCINGIICDKNPR